MTVGAPHARRSFDPDLPARLSPLVALRPESFGALAYHFGNRRLVFVKSPALVEVLGALGRHGTVRQAVAAHVPPDEVDRYVAALGRLYDSEVLDGR